MEIKRREFGRTEHGEKIESFTLSTDYLEVTILNYGLGSKIMPIFVENYRVYSIKHTV